MLQGEDTIPGTVPVRVGETIAGKYEVLRVLGQGGMGIVVEARHRVLEQSVALKFLLPEHVRNPSVASRFLREARVMSQIRSENAARVLDADVLDSGLPFIVMEYLEGVTVAAHLAQRGQLPVSEAVDIVLQAAAGVAEAHAHGVVHRDIKPANLFLTNGTGGLPLVKVLDFGISKVLHASGDGSITQADHVLGSPHYMSPEQMRSPESVDGRSDIWSLGVVLFELLRGQVPFPGRTILAIFAESLSPPELRGSCPNVPVELEAVIRRCLSRQRDARYPSMAELARALLPFGSARAQNWVRDTERLASQVSSLPPPQRLESSRPLESLRPAKTSTWTFRRMLGPGLVAVVALGVGSFRWCVSDAGDSRASSAPAACGSATTRALAPPSSPSLDSPGVPPSPPAPSEGPPSASPSPVNRPLPSTPVEQARRKAGPSTRVHGAEVVGSKPVAINAPPASAGSAGSGGPSTVAPSAPVASTSSPPREVVDPLELDRRQ